MKAMAANHAHAANSLRHMAGAKAKKIEAATLALNASMRKTAKMAKAGIEGWTSV